MSAVEADLVLAMEAGLGLSVEDQFQRSIIFQFREKSNSEAQVFCQSFVVGSGGEGACLGLPKWGTFHLTRSTYYYTTKIFGVDSENSTK